MEMAEVGFADVQDVGLRSEMRWPEAALPPDAPEPAQALNPVDALEADKKRLGSLVIGRVPEVRELVKVLVEKWPDDEWIRHMAYVLEPPVARSVPGSNRPFDQEYAWLKAHAHEYHGCWIAMNGDRLIAADPSYGVVHDVVKAIGDNRGALLTFQGDLPNDV